MDCTVHETNAEDDFSDMISNESCEESEEELNVLTNILYNSNGLDNIEIAYYSQFYAFCLFDDFFSKDVREVWTHMNQMHNFSFKDLCNTFSSEKKRQVDEYDRMKITNFFRSRQLESIKEKKFDNLSNSNIHDLLCSEQWKSDAYIQPALASDLLLYSLTDDIFDKEEACSDKVEACSDKVEACSDKVEAWCNFDALKKCELVTTGEIATKTELYKSTTNSKHCNILLSDTEREMLCEVTDSPSVEKETNNSLIDLNYFESYNSLSVHREMIKDHIRTEAYYFAVTKLKDRIEGKTVLDIGCGTGVLGIFCAKAGAKLVVGIDCAEKTAEIARRIVTMNKLENIFILTGKLENFNIVCTEDGIPALAPLNEKNEMLMKFDVIISEWMGYGLFYESMVYTVIHARDKYLLVDGLILPSHITLGVCGADFIEHLEKTKQSDLFYSENIYGLDLTEIAPKLHKTAVVGLVEPAVITTDVKPICLINLYNVSCQTIRSFRVPFELNILRDKYVSSLVLYFECFFLNTYPNVLEDKIHELCGTPQFKSFEKPFGLQSLTTSPLSPRTHWSQIVLHLKDSDGEIIVLVEGSKKIVKGFLAISPLDENYRSAAFTVEVARGTKVANCMSGTISEQTTRILSTPIVCCYDELDVVDGFH